MQNQENGEIPKGKISSFMKEERDNQIEYFRHI